MTRGEIYKVALDHYTYVTSISGSIITSAEKLSDYLWYYYNINGDLNISFNSYGLAGLFGYKIDNPGIVFTEDLFVFNLDGTGIIYDNAEFNTIFDKTESEYLSMITDKTVYYSGTTQFTNIIDVSQTTYDSLAEIGGLIPGQTYKIADVSTGSTTYGYATAVENNSSIATATQLTVSQAQAMITNGTIIPGQKYKIEFDINEEDYVYVDGVTRNSLDKYGTRQFRAPKSAYYVDDTTTYRGVWSQFLADNDFNAGEYWIWGTYVWKNLTGNKGTSSDPITLDSTNWLKMEKNASDWSDYYDEIFNAVIYDVDGTWLIPENKSGVILVQTSKTNTIINLSSLGGELYSTVYADYNMLSTYNNNLGAMLNNRVNRIVDNYCGHIVNNYINGNIEYNNIYPHNIFDNYLPNGNIEYNKNNGNIYSNSINGDINNNSNNGYINNNSNNGYIDNNSNNGYIYNNSNSGRIYFNSNNGHIQNNSNSGDITNNLNSGYIHNNSNNGFIYNNSNNGYIDNNSITVGYITNCINNGNISGGAGNKTDEVTHK